MLKNFCCTILFLNCFLFAYSQKELQATRIHSNLEIDGKLNEDAWKNAEEAKDFLMNYPSYGIASEFKTKTYFLYSDEAIYIGAKLYDRSTDSVLQTLSQRDDYGNADWFGVILDPYGKQQNGFAFYVTAAGVELDALLEVGNEDFTWNAVWKSRVKITDFGWQVEMRIPLSAFRFPKADVQNWNINFQRQVRRVREMSFWNPVDPNLLSAITQLGKLQNVKGIESPLRLSFTPYITGYLENKSDGKSSNWNERLTGGLDLKYGINDAFTLDMTIIPDFGQTVSDQKVLNLSPFEVQFAENRPFFLEGTDLFGIGGVFYSRRIGGKPYYSNQLQEKVVDSLGEEITSNPTVAPLLNATKVSGRTKSGLGIGVFNAIENESFAEITDSLGNKRDVLSNPYSNYNVLVFSQNLKNSSSFSFINTNVMRNGSARDANVSLASFNLFTPNRKYLVNGKIGASILSEENELTAGHVLELGVGKAQGVWQYGFQYYEESDKYNPNDLGFLQVNNSRGGVVYLKRNTFSPKGKFLRTWSSVGMWYEELYHPALYSNFSLDADFAGTLRNFLTIGTDVSIAPFGTVNHFESREFGNPVNFAPSARIGGFYSSDYSKKVALDAFVNFRQFANEKQNVSSVRISPRLRISDRLFLIWSTAIEKYNKDYGYTPLQDNFGDNIVLGTRDRQLVTNSIQAEFIFTNRMGIDLRFRHYWQNVKYLHFSQLLKSGELERIGYNPQENSESIYNTSYNAFTVDMNYRWVFFPGSELRLAWKYNIFNSIAKLDASYFSTFETLFEQPQYNSISLRFLFFLDVLYFKRKKGERI